jgi:CheY-like chemotaxis protein
MPTALVVEDEPLVRDVIVEQIADAGYNVVERGNADEAIAFLEARQDIRFVFINIDMPSPMNGLKLAAFVRNRWLPAHIVTTTGNSWQMKVPDKRLVHTQAIPIKRGRFRYTNFRAHELNNRYVGSESFVSWDTPFIEPIGMPTARSLVTLRDALNYVNALPTPVLREKRWQKALHSLIQSADREASIETARLEVVLALYPNVIGAHFTAEKDPAFSNVYRLVSKL